MLSALLATGLRAQVCEPSGTTTLNANKVSALIHNGGDMFWDLNSNPGYAVPYNPAAATQTHSVFASSIWLGALDNNLDLHVAAQTYRQTGYDFFNGPFRSTGNYACDSEVVMSMNPNEAVFAHSSGKVIAFNGGNYDVFDPVTGTLTTQTMPVTYFNYNPVELPNGQILLSCHSASTAQPVILLTPPTFAATMGITPLTPHSYSTPVLLQNGRVLLVGNTLAEIYDPAGPTTWATTPPGIAHANSSGITLNNGKVFLSGGGSNGVTASELFNPLDSTWITGPSLLQARTGHVLVKLATGEVLIIGGHQSSTQVELYDPVTNAISPFGNLQQPARYLNAWLLPSGKVLVCSYSSMAATTGTVELFDPALQTSVVLRDVGVGYKAASLPGGLALIQKTANIFREFDPVANEFSHSKWQNIWKVTAAEIAQFQADFAAGSVNFANYPTIETWPGNGNVAIGEDHFLAPFVDVNQDGWYQPALAGDYPCITGDQMVWYVMNDDAGPHTETGGEKLGVQIEVSAYAFDCNSTNCPDSSLDFTTFYHYELVNKSGQNYNRFRLGLWLDADLGNYNDDFVGCDSTRNLGFCFNGDNTDGPGAGSYGANPPAIGALVLNDPESAGMDGFQYYENVGNQPTGNPQNAAEFYNYLNGRWRDSSLVVNDGQDGYGSGPTTQYMFNGDAGWCGGAASGWTEISAGNVAFDRRFLMTTAHTGFAANDTLVYDFAVVWSRGNSNLNSVCQLQADADAISTWWNGQNFGCFDLVMGRDDLEFTSNTHSRIRLAPNPATGHTTVHLPLGFKNTGGQVKLINMMGDLVKAVEVIPGRESISLSWDEVPAGMYIVTAEVGGMVFSERLAIQK